MGSFPTRERTNDRKRSLRTKRRVGRHRRVGGETKVGMVLEKPLAHRLDKRASRVDRVQQPRIIEGRSRRLVLRKRERTDARARKPKRAGAPVRVDLRDTHRRLEQPPLPLSSDVAQKNVASIAIDLPLKQHGLNALLRWRGRWRVGRRPQAPCRVRLQSARLRRYGKH